MAPEQSPSLRQIECLDISDDPVGDTPKLLIVGIVLLLALGLLSEVVALWQLLLKLLREVCHALVYLVEVVELAVVLLEVAVQEVEGGSGLELASHCKWAQD